MSRVKLDVLVNKMVDKWSLEYLNRAKGGDTEAMMQLAEFQFCKTGWGRINHNPIQGRRWVEYAASKGDVYALYTLRQLRIQYEKKIDMIEEMKRVRVANMLDPFSKQLLYSAVQVNKEDYDVSSTPDRWTHLYEDGSLKRTNNLYGPIELYDPNDPEDRIGFLRSLKALNKKYRDIAKKEHVANGTLFSIDKRHVWGFGGQSNFFPPASRHGLQRAIKLALDGKVSQLPRDMSPRPVEEYLKGDVMSFARPSSVPDAFENLTGFGFPTQIMPEEDDLGLLVDAAKVATHTNLQQMVGWLNPDLDTATTDAVKFVEGNDVAGILANDAAFNSIAFGQAQRDFVDIQNFLDAATELYKDDPVRRADFLRRNNVTMADIRLKLGLPALDNDIMNPSQSGTLISQEQLDEYFNFASIADEYVMGQTAEQLGLFGIKLGQDVNFDLVYSINRQVARRVQEAAELAAIREEEDKLNEGKGDVSAGFIAVENPDNNKISYIRSKSPHLHVEDVEDNLNLLNNLEYFRDNETTKNTLRTIDALRRQVTTPHFPAENFFATFMNEPIENGSEKDIAAARRTGSVTRVELTPEFDALEAEVDAILAEKKVSIMSDPKPRAAMARAIVEAYTVAARRQIDLMPVTEGLQTNPPFLQGAYSLEEYEVLKQNWINEHLKDEFAKGLEPGSTFHEILAQADSLAYRRHLGEGADKLSEANLRLLARGGIFARSAYQILANELGLATSTANMKRRGDKKKTVEKFAPEEVSEDSESDYTEPIVPEIDLPVYMGRSNFLGINDVTNDFSASTDASPAPFENDIIQAENRRREAIRDAAYKRQHDLPVSAASWIKDLQHSGKIPSKLTNENIKKLVASYHEAKKQNNSAVIRDQFYADQRGLFHSIEKSDFDIIENKNDMYLDLNENPTGSFIPAELFNMSRDEFMTYFDAMHFEEDEVMGEADEDAETPLYNKVDELYGKHGHWDAGSVTKTLDEYYETFLYETTTHDEFTEFLHSPPVLLPYLRAPKLQYPYAPEVSANTYFNIQAPWKRVDSDPRFSGTGYETVYVEDVFKPINDKLKGKVSEPLAAHGRIGGFEHLKKNVGGGLSLINDFLEAVLALDSNKFAAVRRVVISRFKYEIFDEATATETERRIAHGQCSLNDELHYNAHKLKEGDQGYDEFVTPFTAKLLDVLVDVIPQAFTKEYVATLPPKAHNSSILTMPQFWQDTKDDWLDTKKYAKNIDPEDPIMQYRSRHNFPLLVRRIYGQTSALSLDDEVREVMEGVPISNMEKVENFIPSDNLVRTIVSEAKM